MQGVAVVVDDGLLLKVCTGILHIQLQCLARYGYIERGTGPVVPCIRETCREIVVMGEVCLKEKLHISTRLIHIIAFHTEGGIHLVKLSPRLQQAARNSSSRLMVIPFCAPRMRTVPERRAETVTSFRRWLLSVSVSCATAAIANRMFKDKK